MCSKPGGLPPGRMSQGENEAFYLIKHSKNVTAGDAGGIGTKGEQR